MYLPLLFNTPYYVVIFYSLPFPLSLIIKNAKWTLFYQSFQGNKYDLVDIPFLLLFVFHFMYFFS